MQNIKDHSAFSFFRSQPCPTGLVCVSEGVVAITASVETGNHLFLCEEKPFLHLASSLYIQSACPLRFLALRKRIAEFLEVSSS